MGAPTSIAEVAARQLCTGCGGCAFISPETIEMVDVMKHGRRPRVTGDSSDPRTREALDVCPGADQSHDAMPDGIREGLRESFGPVIEMWEGHAADEEIRHLGSSGGATTALSLYAIEKLGMHGVLHIKSRPDAPWMNRTALSTSRADLLGGTGSRYAPASPADGLQQIADAPGSCVFVGKPCDALAAVRAGRMRPELGENLGLVLSFFCGGTPTHEATIQLLRSLGIDDPSDVAGLRYRGKGWPGRTTADLADGSEPRSTTYMQAWGTILTKNKQWRCNLCPDRTGEFADIACGDPWYDGVPDEAPGRSLILARTERGKRVVREAIEAGYLVAELAEDWKLRKSQTAFPNLRGQIWGRLATLRTLGVPVPRYRGYSFLRHWITETTLRQKLGSFFGTARRAKRRKLGEDQPMTPFEPRTRNEERD